VPSARKQPVVTNSQPKQRRVQARSPKQQEYLDSIDNNLLTFGLGPAGTGKTFLAVSRAVTMLQEGTATRLIMTRPAVEAGENLGFLPGTLEDKLDPYLRPLTDAIHDLVGPIQLEAWMATGVIEVAPLAYLRGRTLSKAFIILDEAQNTTPAQMKMFLTRIGFDSRVVVTGDCSQVDISGPNGLDDAARLLSSVHGVGTVELSRRDIVRSPLVSRIIAAYDADEAA
jgi:phosphate starvation-inducible PhoH-like protein